MQVLNKTTLVEYFHSKEHFNT